jgi:hypothetical protein
MTWVRAMRQTLVCGLAFLFWFGACGSAYAQSSSEPLGVLLLLLGVGGAGTAGVLLLNSRRKSANARKLLATAEHSDTASSEPQDADESVFAPPIARPSQVIWVQIVIHTPAREAEARSRAQKIDASAEELASTPLTIPLKRNDRIKATLYCDSAHVPEAVQTTKWNGRLVCLYFSIKMPSVAAECVVTPKLRVFVNGVPAGYVIFKIKVIPDVEYAAMGFVSQQGHSFQRAFLSYANENRVQVLKAAQLLSALRVHYFQDVLSQRPGDRWRERLFSEIEKCDVFLLFWSRYARDSEWVIKEAEYALRCSKMAPTAQPLEIVPILLEGPPPPAPPKSLEELNFNDPIRYAVFAEQSVPTVRLASIAAHDEADSLGFALTVFVILFGGALLLGTGFLIGMIFRLI